MASAVWPRVNWCACTRSAGWSDAVLAWDRAGLGHRLKLMAGRAEKSASGTAALSTLPPPINRGDHSTAPVFAPQGLPDRRAQAHRAG